MIAFVACAVIAAPVQWTATEGQLNYNVVHKLHEVNGKSSKAQIIAMVDDDGMKVMARVAVNSFDSGNENRDAHVLEVTEAATHPTVVVKGVAKGFTLPAAGALATADIPVEVEFHGKKQVVQAKLTVKAESDKRMQASISFETSLDAHGVERPSLLFIKVNDALTISGTFTMEPKS